ncbi:efflux RND transporter periplasmic adaptor subunit, partial [Mesorhizobium sp. M7A.F.Ca.CA.004.12.1.1]
MRGKVVLSLLAVACLGAAGWLYLSPDALGRVQQVIGAKQVAAPDKQAAASDKKADNAGRSVSILSAVASTA